MHWNLFRSPVTMNLSSSVVTWWKFFFFLSNEKSLGPKIFGLLRLQHSGNIGFCAQLPVAREKLDNVE